MKFRQKGQDNNLCQKTNVKIFTQVDLTPQVQLVWGCRQNARSPFHQGEYWYFNPNDENNKHVVPLQRSKGYPEYIYFLTEEDVKAYIGPKAKKIV